MTGGTPARTALFVVSIFNYHREVFPVVQDFREAGWKVVVLLGWIGEQADSAQSEYERLGCRVVRPSPQYSYGNPDIAHSSGRHTGKPAPRPAVLRRLRGFLGQFRFIRRGRVEIEALLSEAAPAVIFCGPFHSCGMMDNSAMRWAHKQGIPICCYPVSAYHGEKGAVRARFQNIEVGMVPRDIEARYDVINWALAKVFRSWTRSKGGNTIFMWEPLRMLASYLNGLLEKEVWQKPSTGFDAVFVFFPLSRRLLEESGYPMEKVFVTGVPLLDSACARITDLVARRQLFEDLGLGDGEPFLLFNVEPSAEHNYADWDVHWSRFRSLMEVVKEAGIPAILSLHPLCREQDYQFAEAEYGVRISRNYKIYDLYPFCRISVSFVCSTNLLAGYFGKPLVIYDFFGLAGEHSERADEYRLPGALVANSVPGVAELVKRVLRAESDTGSYEAHTRASEAMRLNVENLLAGKPS